MGLGTVSLMISGRFVDGLIEEVDRFRDESAEVSVALGGRFEKSASPKASSIALWMDAANAAAKTMDQMIVLGKAKAKARIRAQVISAQAPRLFLLVSSLSVELIQISRHPQAQHPQPLRDDPWSTLLLCLRVPASVPC